MPTRATSFCRFCHAFCGISVEVDDGRVTKVIGDIENPLYGGFTCPKGRALPEQHNHPDRLLHSQQRSPDGSHRPVAVEQAMDEIAVRICDIIRESGPRAVATYTGTYGVFYPTGKDMGKAFLRAIGSPMRFSSSTIDQPGKAIARELHGTWNAGPQSFVGSDTWIVIGANPIVSMWGGIPHYNPSKHLRDAKAQGLKLIVIDPRRTETAANADVFLQPRPGEDPTILAGLIRVILDENLYDRSFTDGDVEGLTALADAVGPFTPEYVERRAKVPADLVLEAARLFASGRRGSVTAGTGPNMAPRGTLMEYLVASLQTICGRWLRAGEPVPNPYVLLPQRIAKAQADPRKPAWGYGEQLRVRNLGENASGLPTAALADEILLEGNGRVRALICIGGNPLVAWPDQLKTDAALRKLDLLVTIDIKMSATARRADYVIAPKLSLEVDGITLENERIWGYAAATAGYPVPYAQFAPALVEPPEGSDLIEDWEFFYGLGRRLGLELEIDGVAVDMEKKPTTDDLHQMMTRNARIPLDDVKKHPHGSVFPDASIVVEPKDSSWPHRLDVGNDLMMRELAEVASEPIVEHAGYRAADRFTYRLVSRRLRDVYNSSGQDIPHLVRKYAYNPAFMHPGDMAAEGLASGDVVEIDSGHAQILGVVEPAAELARSVISMAHGWGGAPENYAQVRTIGSNTGRLSSTDRDFDPITGLPVMSAIPVNIRPVLDQIAETPIRST